ncbi:peptidase domain-containing ABC transporter [Hymenobacter coalescens]
MKAFPVYKQLDEMDCGPTCLRMVTKFHGRSYPIDYLREKSNITRSGASLGGLAEAAEGVGMSTLALHSTLDMLREDIPLPCIAYWRGRHYVVVYKVTPTKIYVADPAFGRVTYTPEQFLQGWLPPRTKVTPDSEGLVLVLEPTPAFYEGDEEGLAKPRQGLSFLWPYLRPFRKYFYQLLLSLVVGGALQLIFPFLMQALVDNGINTQNLHFVNLILLAQLTLFASRTFVEVIRTWLLIHVTSRVNVRLLSSFLLKLLRLPISFFDSKNVGDLMQRIQDHTRIQTFLSVTTLDVVFSTLNLAIFGTILYIFDGKIFLIFLVGSALYVGWVMLFMKRRAELDFLYFDQASGNQSSTLQLINGVQEIKLNNSERRRRQEWEAMQIRLAKLTLKSVSVNQLQTTGANFINEIKNIIITYIAAKSVIDGQISLGAMLSVQYIIGQLNVPITNFLSFSRTYQDARLSIERLVEVHSKEEEEDTREGSLTFLTGDADIHVGPGVSFRYGSRNAPLVLRDLDIVIPAGKVTAIVGASGSGKTTLLKLLLKFYAPTEGRIQAGGVSLSALSTSYWRRQCGIVLQEGYIFADTIARNISESDSDGRIDPARLLEAARIANILEFVEALPNGFNTRIGASGMALSGGQKQRILIARAVYKNPTFLFFDEATSALDANNERVIMQNLQEFYHGRTVVIVAHRLSTVRHADQLLVLHQGQVVERGTHDTLTATQGEYYRLVKNQLELGN